MEVEWVMVFLIKSIELHDFLSHKDTKLYFPQGVTAIVGDNGAGKTSIIDAIIVSIGDREDLKIRGKKANLVRRGAIKASISIEFEIDNKKYKLYRTISRSEFEEPSERRLYEYFNGKWMLKAQGSRVIEELRKIIGINPKIINTIAILRQGKLHDLIMLFTSTKYKKKQQLIDELIELNKYREAYEKLKKILTYKITLPDGTRISVSPWRNDVENLRRFILNFRSKKNILSKELKELENNITDLENKKNKLKQELRIYYSKLDEAKKELEELRKKVEAYERLESKLRDYVNERNRLSAEIEVLEKELNNYKEQLDSLRKYALAYNNLKELKEKSSRLELLKQQYNSIKESISLIRKFSELLDLEVEEKCREYEVLREKLLQKKTELDNLDKQYRELSIELDQLTKQYNIITKSIKEYEKELSNKTPDDIEKELRKVIEQKTIVENKISDFNEKISMLYKARAKCPLCGRELTEEHRRKLIDEYRKNLRVLEQEKDAITRKYTNLITLKNKIRIIYESLLRKREKAKNIEEDINELKNKLNDIVSKKNSLVNEINMILNKIKEFEEINIDQLYREYLSLKEALNLRNISRTSEEELVEKLSKLENEINEKKRDVDKLLDTLSSILEEDRQAISANIDVFERRAKLYKEEYDRVYAKTNKIQGELSSRRVYLERIEKEIESIRNELSKYDIDSLRKRLEELAVIEERINTKVMELEKSIALIEAKIEDYKKEYSEKSKELDNYIKFLEKAERIYKIISIAWYLRENVLNTEKAPEALRARVIRLLSQETSRILREFDLEYTMVEVSPELDITVSSANAVHSLAELSGGEQVATVLALILALHKIVSKGRLGLLVLDEPTIHLDLERRRKLIDIIKNFRGGQIIPQLIVITHNREVEEASDHVFEVVKKPNGISIVKMLQY